MVYSVVTCYQELLHAVQCCYMLHCVVEFCAAVLYVVCSCMCVVACCAVMCSVVTCCQELLHAVQCCYMLHCVCCDVFLHAVQCCYLLQMYYMLCRVVRCYQELLHVFVQQC